MNISSAKLNKAQVVRVYSNVASVYDIWGTLTESKARSRAIERANIRNGETILEVAVGTGMTFFEILKANPDGENIGIDLTPAMLQKAIHRAARAGSTQYELTCGDAYDLQFPDGHFDLLMNNYMFDLLPEEDFPKVLAGFRRVLKPVGRLVLVNMTRGERVYQKIWESVYHVNAEWLGGCRGVLLQKYLIAAGFRNVEREMISQFGFPSEIISAVN